MSEVAPPLRRGVKRSLVVSDDAGNVLLFDDSGVVIGAVVIKIRLDPGSFVVGNKALRPGILL